MTGLALKKWRDTVLRCHAWGDGRDERSNASSSDGQRLEAETHFLSGRLARLDRALILEVEIDRDNTRDQDADHEALGYRWYSRLYLLCGDGRPIPSTKRVAFGQKLIAALKVDETDITGQWMAQYLAEMIARADTAAPDQKPAAEQLVFDRR